jgi:DNA-binding response OmpR family regulator
MKDVSLMNATSQTTTTAPSSRKAIHAAGILIVQPDPELAANWRDTLIDFGMSGAQVVGDADGAVQSILARKPSGIVIALPSQIESHDLMARLTGGECGILDDIPVILVMPRPTRSAVIAAAGAGFDAVLPFPLSPRLIYRRMGSLMQKARRSARQKFVPHLSLHDVMDGGAGSGVN